MAELARVHVAAAPACPKCRNRLTDLPLDDMAAGDEYQCLFCSQVIRIPQAVLERLIEQREALRREQAQEQPNLFQRVALFFRRLFGP
jgi:tRNA(Ile2) C34 agmatinyltransferase TiaS